MNILLIKVLAALALVGGLAAFEHYRIEAAEQRGFDRATSERAARDNVALVTRLESNAAAVVKDEAINRFITKEHHEKLDPVVDRIVHERVRVGPAICGPAAAAKTEDARSGDSADSSGRLVRPDIERDFIALKLAVEKDLATGRSCQEWGREHGFFND